MRTWGREIMNSCALAALAAFTMSSLETFSSGRPYAMFSPTETENRTGSWGSQREEWAIYSNRFRELELGRSPGWQWKQHEPSPSCRISERLRRPRWSGLLLAVRKMPMRVTWEWKKAAMSQLDGRRYLIEARQKLNDGALSSSTGAHKGSDVSAL